MRLSTIPRRAITTATTACSHRIATPAPIPILRLLSRPFTAEARTSPRYTPRKTVSGTQFATTSTSTATTDQFNVRNMATAKQIVLSPTNDTGVWGTGVTEDSARTASEVLQEDLEKHHVFFNNMGFHSERPHHHNDHNVRGEGMTLI